MIQRIQSLWLLLAALVNSAIFYFDIFRSTDGNVHIRIADHYPSMLFGILIVVLPVLAIFMFKNRKRQLAYVYISLLATLGFLALQLWRVKTYLATTPVAGNYFIGSVLPAVAIILLIMARRGISKDEKLVRSTDRLR